MKKKLMNNFGLKALAFLSAVIMWFLVVNLDDPITKNTYYDIPVTVVNEEVVTESNRTYQIVDDTQTVNVTVTAKGSDLKKISSDDIVATADMKELSLGTQVPIQISIEGKDYVEAYSNPRNLQVKIDEEAKNNFPITPTTTGTVREGYVIGELSANPEKVTIRGPKTVINSISRVCAEVNVSGLSENATLEATLVLYDANNNVIDQTLLANNLGEEGVSVDVELFQTKNVPLKFDTSKVTAAKGYSISDISYEPQEVQVSGEESVVKALSEIDVPAEELEYTDLTEKTEVTVDIQPYLPEGVALTDTNANNVVVVISVNQPGAKSFEVSTASIIVNNLDDSLELGYGTTVDLEIQIKGPDEVLNSLSLAKKVSIDMNDYTKPGTYEVPVAVELPDDCELVKDITVEVVLEEKQEDKTEQEEEEVVE